MFEDLSLKLKTLENGVLAPWLDNVMNWSPQLRTPTIRTWLKVFGVPSHVWSEDTFRNIVGKCGTLIQLDQDMIAPSSFERGRLQIEIDWQLPIDESLSFGPSNVDIRSGCKEKVMEDVLPRTPDYVCRSKGIQAGQGDLDGLNDVAGSGRDFSLFADIVVANSLEPSSKGAARMLTVYGKDNWGTSDTDAIEDMQIADNNEVIDRLEGNLDGPRTELPRAGKAVTIEYDGVPHRVRHMSELLPLNKRGRDA
ncbi:hypothetical protein V6N13_139852 [Hibiscus sabdariffa]